MPKLIIIQNGIFVDGNNTPAYQVAKYDYSDGAYHTISTTMTLRDARIYLESCRED